MPSTPARPHRAMAVARENPPASSLGASTPRPEPRPPPPVDESFRRIVAALAQDGGLLGGEPCLGHAITDHLTRPDTQLQRVALWSARRRAVVYVKLLRPVAIPLLQLRTALEQLHREYDELVRVSRAFEGLAHLATVRPIRLFEDELAIVTEAADGVTLDRLVNQEASIGRSGPSVDRLGTAAARIAEWLRRFQSMSAPSTIDLAATRVYWEERLSALLRREEWRFETALSRGVLARFDQLVATLTLHDRIAVDVHADLTTENVLVDDQRVIVLDFIGGRVGNRFHDLAQLYMQLEVTKQKPWLASARVSAMQHALLEAFEPNLSLEHPLLQLALIQQILAGLLQRATTPAPWLKAHYSRFLWRTLEGDFRALARH